MSAVISSFSRPARNSPNPRRLDRFRRELKAGLSPLPHAGSLSSFHGTLQVSTLSKHAPNSPSRGDEGTPSGAAPRTIVPYRPQVAKRSLTLLTEVEGPAIPLRRRPMLVPLTASCAAWPLLRSKPKREHNVVQVLHHVALRACGTHVVGTHWHGRAPAGRVPPFPSYVFGRCDRCKPPVQGRRARVLTGPFARHETLADGNTPAGNQARPVLRLFDGGRRVGIDARRIETAPRPASDAICSPLVGTGLPTV